MTEDQDQDFYQILGVHPKANSNEIKESFRRLAQKYHPDAGSTDSSDIELFKRVTEAYRVLMDPESRNDYNKEKGYLFHEEISVGGVSGESPELEESDGNVSLSGVDRDLLKLQKMASSSDDLTMQQKVAGIDPESLESSEDEEEDVEVTPWGDNDSAQSGGGLLGSLLSGKNKDRSFQNRAELKKNLKKTFKEESKPKKPSLSFEKPNESYPSPEFNNRNTDSAGNIEDPLRKERLFRFQITSLEAALGCQRELVLSHGDASKVSKVEVEIPPGIEDGTVIEVARGWERANAEISVVQDIRFQVSGDDLKIRVPITLKEALDGAKIRVPGIKSRHEVTLLSGSKACNSIIVEDAGVFGRGTLEVIPYIVAPNQTSSTMMAAASVVDEHYTDKNVRSSFLKDPISEEYSAQEDSWIIFYPPIIFSEALKGVSIEINVEGNTLVLEIPSAWNHQKAIEIGSEKSPLDKTILIQPQIILPEKSSPELQAAALAIEQHFLSQPRSHLPSNLKTK